jgi:hypothetical protein
MRLSGNHVGAAVLVVLALLAVLLGSSSLQAIGLIVLVIAVMAVLVDLVSPGANRLHFRYRGRFGVRSYGDRRVEPDHDGADHRRFHIPSRARAGESAQAAAEQSADKAFGER